MLFYMHLKTIDDSDGKTINYFPPSLLAFNSNNLY